MDIDYPPKKALHVSAPLTSLVRLYAAIQPSACRQRYMSTFFSRVCVSGVIVVVVAHTHTYEPHEPGKVEVHFLTSTNTLSRFWFRFFSSFLFLFFHSLLRLINMRSRTESLFLIITERNRYLPMYIRILSLIPARHAT